MTEFQARTIEAAVFVTVILAAMVALDVPGWQRWAMYAGVRVGAWRAWGCYRDADIYREAWGLE